jgi:DNA-binding Lrp family transcriptional regulator
LTLDKIDYKILRELLIDSRQSYREIAKKVGVSVGTALLRVKRMEKDGVIKGYSAMLDYEKIGYELTVIVEVSVSKGRLIEMEKDIAKLPITCAVYDVTGLTDAIIIAKFQTRETLSNFTKKILAMPYVERTNTHIVLTTVKEDFRIGI